ncbi:TonB family protein [Synechocystis sp. PCC 7339]|uniref:energy transducer TonB family protein n=1 Tax=unclassified Synechocystis TaxID=2640012 RepID=UPI001BAFC460|nr:MULTISPECIES: energy transducer TonB [unclassified Synechocystis]QUS60314.1 TonB family protein [Synechocystis sp. PCC 7338]UAJ72237.1 TonB family protein [Synechocystis sp. PCC 7339]
MSISTFCLTQRSQQYQNSQKIILAGAACSLLIHGAIGAFWRFPLDTDTPVIEPIEFIVVDPSPNPEVTPPTPKEQKTEQKKAEPRSDVSPPPPATPSTLVTKAVLPPPIIPPVPPVNSPPSPVVENPISLPNPLSPAPTTPVPNTVLPPVEQAITPSTPKVNPLLNPVTESPVSLTKPAQSAFRLPFSSVDTPEFAPIPEQAPAVAPAIRSATPKSLANSSAQQPSFGQTNAAPPSQGKPSANQDSFTAIANANAVSQGGAPIKPGTATKPITNGGGGSAPTLGSSQPRAERPGGGNSGANVGPIAANPVTSSAPPKPKPSPSAPAKPEPLKCVSQCKPSYPSILQGEEGSATVLVSVNDSGSVTSVTITNAHGNSEVNRQALLAARKMQFTAPVSGQSKSVPVVIHFTVAGSDFDRQARERRQQQEELRQAARRAEEEKANQARQRQLEEERQARQRQLEKEREERLRQFSVESGPSPAPAVKVSPPPSPEPAPSSAPKTEPTVEIEKLEPSLEQLSDS